MIDVAANPNSQLLHHALHYCAALGRASLNLPCLPIGGGGEGKFKRPDIIIPQSEEMLVF